MAEAAHPDDENTQVEAIKRAAAEDIAEAFDRPALRSSFPAADTEDDPWGADRSAQADWSALAEQAVKNGGRIRQLEVALAAEKAKTRASAKSVDDVEALRGELAIRKFLDDLAEQGLPSTLYQSFSPEFREYIQKRLIFWADTANRMLGEFYSLSPAAVAHRDRLFAEEDEEAGGSLTIKQGSTGGSGSLEDLLNGLLGHDHDEDEDDDE